MKELLKETFQFVPATIINRAIGLKNQKQYKQALALLEKNVVEFSVLYNGTGTNGFVQAKINKEIYTRNGGEILMPIYEFECPIHGKFERVFSLREFDTIKSGVICNQYIDTKQDCFVAGEEYRCMKIATLEWSLPVYPSHGKPTIVFRNKQTGEAEVALYEHQQVPAGFVKEELKTPYERSKFEKEQQAQQNLEDEYKTEERRFN